MVPLSECEELRGGQGSEQIKGVDDVPRTGLRKAAGSHARGESLVSDESES